MRALTHDLRSAVRQLVRHPGFAAAAVLILGLGIGLNSAVFSLINAMLFRPLPVAAPEQMVAVYSSEPTDFMAASALAPADYADLRELSRSFSALFAYAYAPMALEYGGENRLVLAVRATPEFFATLGIKPFLGRFFTSADDAEAQLAVLSYSAWQRRFGADPSVVGATVRLNGRGCRVIGVARKEFFGLTRGVSPELWTPLNLRLRDRREARKLRSLWVMGRSSRGVSLARVQAELRVLAGRLAREFPATNAERDFVAFPANTVRILPGVDAKLAAASAVVLGVVGLVLLIACTNVANLFLARALARRREIATRRALGAEPAAVVRQLLVESLLVALLGGALGLAGAWVANAAVSALRLPLPIDLALGLALDGRVLLFTLGVSALTVLTFGLAPAVAAARGDLAGVVRDGAPSAAGRLQRRLSGLLVAAQIALSFILLIDTGLAVRSLSNAHRVDPGFDSRGVVVATFAPQLQGYTRGEIETFYRRLIERVRALPGIESAALASHLPLAVEIAFDRVATAATAAPPERWPSVDSAMVGPGYFETLRIPVLRGRGFADADREGSPLAVVINRAFAGRFWPGGEAVGQSLRLAGVAEPYTVVGVVRDGKYRTLGEPSRPFLYRALAQNRWRPSGDTGEITSGSETLVARTRSPASTALAAVRRAIRELDEHCAIARLATLEETLGVALFLPRAAAALFAVFGLLGLVLASVGLYGLLTYAVGQRVHEIGVRMALGATRGEILALIVRRGLGLSLLGLAAGLLGAAATTRFLSAVLYGISPSDPAAFLAVASLLLSVALLASFFPARRAMLLDPVAALRHE